MLKCKRVNTAIAGGLLFASILHICLSEMLLNHSYRFLVYHFLAHHLALMTPVTSLSIFRSQIPLNCHAWNPNYVINHIPPTPEHHLLHLAMRAYIPQNQHLRYPDNLHLHGHLLNSVVSDRTRTFKLMNWLYQYGLLHM